MWDTTLSLRGRLRCSQVLAYDSVVTAPASCVSECTSRPPRAQEERHSYGASRAPGEGLSVILLPADTPEPFSAFVLEEVAGLGVGNV